MAHTYARYYVGAVQSETPAVKKHILQGKITLSTDGGDAYNRTTRLPITFHQLSNIERVLGLYSDAVANTGMVPFIASISGNIVTVGLLESGNAVGPLPEKVAEAHDQTYAIYITVIGV